MTGRSLAAAQAWSMRAPAVHYGNLAPTSRPSAGGKGERVQVIHRDADGTRVCIIDRPEAPQDQP